MGAIWKTKVGCHGSEAEEGGNKLEGPDDAG
jgi:hypothetical protein